MDFIGDADLVPCEVEATSSIAAETTFAGQTYQIPTAGAAKGAAQLVLRPHALHLYAPEQPGLAGAVTSAANLGKEVQYKVETVVGPLFVVAPVQANPFRQGDAVSVAMVEGLERFVSA